MKPEVSLTVNQNHAMDQQFGHDHEDKIELQHLLAIPMDGALLHEKLPKISVKGLVRYTDNGDLILSDVSLDIHRGTIMSVIGPSGSGKSTFLRALNRLWEPPADCIFLDGQDITKLDVVSVRRRVGMMFQVPTLFDGTVVDNLNYGPSLRGEKLSEAKLLEVLKLADLDSAFLTRSVVGLSVGQAQRVALARTLANDPEVLLLDEPTSALDPLSTQKIEDSILNLKRLRGLTIVLVSHSIKQVQRIADHVCVIVKGEVVDVSNPRQLANSSHPLVQKFLQAS